MAEYPSYIYIYINDIPPVAKLFEEGTRFPVKDVGALVKPLDLLRMFEFAKNKFEWLSH